MGMLFDDQSCGECCGSGKSWDDKHRCWHCVGTGMGLTELGREVVRLMDEVTDRRREQQSEAPK